MDIKELASLIDQHAEYCVMKYQPSQDNNYNNDILKLQSEMMQSLTHFSIWLTSVKLKEKN